MIADENALDYAFTYYLAAKAVEDSFYVNLPVELKTFFDKGGFLLRKYELQCIDPELLDQQLVRTIHSQIRLPRHWELNGMQSKIIII